MFRTLLGAALVALSACGGGAAPTASAPPTTAATPAAVASATAAPSPVDMNAAKAEGTVSWYTSTPQNQAQKIADMFTAKTGIKVQLFRSGGEAVMTRFLTEQDAGKTAADVVTTSEVSVSVTVDDTRRLEAVVDNLRNFAEVSCERDMAIICAVGENLRSDVALFGRAVTALERIPLRMVSQAASRRNITFVLRGADVPHAMMRLHETFFCS